MRPNQWLDPNVTLLAVTAACNPFEAHPALRRIWADERSAHAEADTVKDLALGINNDPHLNRVDLIVDRAGEVVGITGYFRPVADDETRLGLRWHGIVPEHRGKGYSELAVAAVCRVAVAYHPIAEEIVEYVPMADRAKGQRLVEHFKTLGFIPDAAPKDASEWPSGLSLPEGSGDWLAMRRSLAAEQFVNRTGAQLAHCIECGCHDLAACHDEETNGPCSWIALDRQAGTGVCSACPDALARWNAGERSFAVPVGRAEN